MFQNMHSNTCHVSDNMGSIRLVVPHCLQQFQVVNFSEHGCRFQIKIKHEAYLQVMHKMEMVRKH